MGWSPRSAKEREENIPSSAASSSFAFAAAGDLPSFLLAAMESSRRGDELERGLGPANRERRVPPSESVYVPLLARVLAGPGLCIVRSSTTWAGRIHFMVGGVGFKHEPIVRETKREEGEQGLRIFFILKFYTLDTNLTE